MDEALFEALASEPRLMPHLHLSLQSGDDLILKRMKRRHSRAQAIRFCDRVRSLRPDIVLGADIIAGFPTETGPMFETTCGMVEACGLTYLHVFPYSPRPGTPADRMPPVEPQTIVRRAAKLRAIGQARQSAYLSGLVGRDVEVLMERGGHGRTPQFAEVAVSPAPAAGTITRVRITRYDGFRLSGTPVSAGVRASQTGSSAAKVR